MSVDDHGLEVLKKAGIDLESPPGKREYAIRVKDIGDGSGVVNTVVTIFNIAVGTANTEVSQALPANTKEFLIRCRGTSRLQLSYTSGESGTKYLTVAPGNVFQDNNFYVAKTIYFQTSKIETVELVCYS